MQKNYICDDNLLKHKLAMIDLEVEKKESFFKPCRVYWWSGYYIPVRNNWSFKIEYRHLSEKERTQFETKFGNKIISNLEFDKWISDLIMRKN